MMTMAAMSKQMPKKKSVPIDEPITTANEMPGDDRDTFHVRFCLVLRGLLRRTRAGCERSPSIVDEVVDDEDHAHRLSDSTVTQIHFCCTNRIPYDFNFFCKNLSKNSSDSSLSW